MRSNNSNRRIREYIRQVVSEHARGLRLRRFPSVTTTLHEEHDDDDDISGGGNIVYSDDEIEIVLS